MNTNGIRMTLKQRLQGKDGLIACGNGNTERLKQGMKESGRQKAMNIEQGTRNEERLK